MSKRWSLSTRIGRGDSLSHVKQREGTYRSGGAWGDVEEGHPILGALRNGKVFWDCVKRLQMYQHLVCLVDAGKEEAVSHKSPHSPLCCPSQCRACTHSTPCVLRAHLHQESFKENAAIPRPSAKCVLKGLQCRSLIHTEDDQSWKLGARGGICWVARSNSHPGQETVVTHKHFTPETRVMCLLLSVWPCSTAAWVCYNNTWHLWDGSQR